MDTNKHRNGADHAPPEYAPGQLRDEPRTTLGRWLTPPVFPDDELETRRAALLNIVLIVSLLFIALVVAGNILGGRTPVLVTIIDLATFVLCLIFRRFMHQGKVRLASIGVIALIMVLLTFDIASLGTVRSPATAIYVSAVIIAGLLFDTAGMITTTVLSSLFILLLIGAENANLLPHPDFSVTITQWITYTAQLGTVAGLVYFGLQSFRQALLRADKELTERKRAEEQLRTTLESFGGGFFACDADWRFVYVNAPAERILGIKRDEVIGKNHWEVFPFTLGTQLEREYRRAASGEPRDFENFYEPWGRWFHNRCYPREAGGMSVYFEDITERKRSEQTLQTTMQRFYTVLSSMYVGILLVTNESRVEFANQAFCDLFDLHYSPSALINFTSAQIIEMIRSSYRQPEAEIARIKELVDRGLPVRSEEIAMSGGRTYLRDFVTLYVDGKLSGRLWYHLDITDRKRAEEQLRESEQRFKAIASSSPDHLLVQDRDLRYTMVLNPQLGMTEEGMIGKTDYEILSKEDAANLTQVKRQVLETGESAHLETSVISSTGGREYFDGSYVPKVNALGEVEGLIGYFRNVTLQKKREAELARLNRTLRAHSHSDRALLRATLQTELMQEACRIIVEDCGHVMAWIGFAEEDEAKSVRPVAYAGFEERYLETLHITWADSERGQGPTGTAIRTGQPSFCRNMTTDPKFAPWRDEALRRGYAASLVLPLLDNGRAFGALTIYFREPDPFTEDEVTLLAALADDLAYGIRMLRLRDAHAQAENALRSSEERYRSLFEKINEGFALHEIVCDASGKPIDYRFLDINPAFERLTGLKRDVIGKTVRTVMPDTEDYWIDRYGRVVLTGKPDHFENYSGALGHYYEVFSYRPAPGQFAVLFLNVTERKKAEDRIQRLNEELRQQTEQLQEANVRLEETLEEEKAAREEAVAGRNILESLMQYAPEVIFIADAPGASIRLVSHYSETLTGRPLPRLRGIPVESHPLSQDLFQPDGITPVTYEELPIVRAVKHGETVMNCEMILRRPDGEVRTILASAGPIRDARSNITGGISVWHDITARKQAEIQIQKLNRDLERRAVDLEMANKELESFSYSISHDLRTPLSAISGFAQLLLTECGEQLPHEALSYLELIRDNTAEMNQLVEGLLTFSRFVRQPLQKQTVDLSQLVYQVLEDLRAQQQGRRVEIKVGPLPGCRADPVLLKQVFMNLLSNALKFTRKREVARIEVNATRTEGGEILYSVCDNGVGFDSAQAEKLFGVFQRLHSQEDYEGTGVGLAIVERVIKRHGGRVCADAEIDKGATFYFTVPD